MSLKVAITGNMGSGKTTACGMFEAFGIAVFNADSTAKELYQHPMVRQAIVERFGSEVYNEVGKIRTDRLATLLFSDAQNLSFVETLIHPMVQQAYGQWKTQHQSAAYTLYETAILFEKGLEKRFDKVIYVAAPEAARLKRLLKRDKSDEARLKQRMNLQWPDEKKMALSDFILINKQLKELKEQVKRVHNQLLSVAQNKSDKAAGC